MRENSAENWMNPSAGLSGNGGMMSAVVTHMTLSHTHADQCAEVRGSGSVGTAPDGSTAQASAPRASELYLCHSLALGSRELEAHLPPAAKWATRAHQQPAQAA